MSEILMKKYIEQFLLERCVFYETFKSINEKLRKKGNLIENRNILYLNFTDWFKTLNIGIRISKKDFFHFIETDIIARFPYINQYQQTMKAEVNGLKKCRNGECYWFLLTKDKLEVFLDQLEAKGSNKSCRNKLFQDIVMGVCELLPEREIFYVNLDEVILELNDILNKYQKLNITDPTFDRDRFDHIHSHFKRAEVQLKQASNAADLFMDESFRSIFYQVFKLDQEYEKKLIFRGPHIPPPLSH